MLVFILILCLAVAGVFIARSQRTYGSTLEDYISSHNPQHAGDVERLTVEYNMKVNKGLL